MTQTHAKLIRREIGRMQDLHGRALARGNTESADALRQYIDRLFVKLNSF